MKLLRHGFGILGGFYLALTILVGCAHFHPINFLNEACIKPYKAYNYHTCEPMTAVIDGKKFTVPKNFDTDLASIPRILWPIFAPQYSGFMAPAILHDYLYRCHPNITRKFADEALYSALLTEGVSIFTAGKFYMAVRIFGSHNFGKLHEGC